MFIGLGLSLVGIGELTNSSIFCSKCVLLMETRQRSSAKIKVCPAHEARKTPTEPKVYSSLTLGILSMIKLMSIYFIQSLHG
jgi:hypothetical protein